MIEDIFNENPVIEKKVEKNFDELDAEVIKKLCSNEINIDATVKSLEKWYKGEFKLFSFISTNTKQENISF